MKQPRNEYPSTLVGSCAGELLVEVLLAGTVSEIVLETELSAVESEAVVGEEPAEALETLETLSAVVEVAVVEEVDRDRSGRLTLLDPEDAPEVDGLVNDEEAETPEELLVTELKAGDGEVALPVMLATMAEDEARGMAEFELAAAPVVLDAAAVLVW